jgi:hypothetical protein
MDEATLMRDRRHGHTHVIPRRPLKIQRRSHASEPYGGMNCCRHHPSAQALPGWDPMMAGEEMERVAARVRGIGYIWTSYGRPRNDSVIERGPNLYQPT